MAWCKPCERYLTPGSLAADGSCPACGSRVQHPGRGALRERTPVSSGERAGRVNAPKEVNDTDLVRIPWHFWLLMTAAAVYLGWRAVQGVALLLAL